MMLSTAVGSGMYGIPRAFIQVSKIFEWRKTMEYWAWYDNLQYFMVFSFTEVIYD